jgi:hypothetical protein
MTTNEKSLFRSNSYVRIIRIFVYIEFKRYPQPAMVAKTTPAIIEVLKEREISVLFLFVEGNYETSFFSAHPYYLLPFAPCIT